MASKRTAKPKSGDRWLEESRARISLKLDLQDLEDAARRLESSPRGFNARAALEQIEKCREAVRGGDAATAASAAIGACAALHLAQYATAWLDDVHRGRDQLGALAQARRARAQKRAEGAAGDLTEGQERSEERRREILRAFDALRAKHPKLSRRSIADRIARLSGDPDEKQSRVESLLRRHGRR